MTLIRCASLVTFPKKGSNVLPVSVFCPIDFSKGYERILISDEKLHEIFWREIFHEIFREIFLKFQKFHDGLWAQAV